MVFCYFFCVSSLCLFINLTSFLNAYTFLTGFFPKTRDSVPHGVLFPLGKDVIIHFLFFIPGKIQAPRLPPYQGRRAAIAKVPSIASKWRAFCYSLESSKLQSSGKYFLDSFSSSGHCSQNVDLYSELHDLCQRDLRSDSWCKGERKWGGEPFHTKMGGNRPQLYWI